jgi:endonuclease G
MSMIRSIAAAFVVAFLATAAHAQPAGCPQFFVASTAPATTFPVEVVCHTEYAIGFNTAWEEPAWSAEHLTRDQANAGKATPRDGNCPFHAEDALPVSERIKPGDYTNQGYDRGHMSPAGDFGADKPESCSMANMVPQLHVLNANIWAGIEAAVRDWAISSGEAYIVTGPLVPAAHTSIAHGRVAVPSHTWKAVYSPAAGAGAYLCSNIPAPVCSEESIAALAEQIGFDPFPGLPASVKAAAIRLPEPTKGGTLTN